MAHDAEGARRGRGAPEVITPGAHHRGRRLCRRRSTCSGFDPDTGSQVGDLAAPGHHPGRPLLQDHAKPTSTAASCSGARLADRLSAYPGDVVTLIPPTPAKVNAALGVAVPRALAVRGDRALRHRDVPVRQPVRRACRGRRRSDSPGWATRCRASRSGCAIPSGRPKSAERLERELRLSLPRPRLADPELEPLQRAPAGEAGDGPDHLLHHGRGGLQHRRHADHGGDRQDAGDRHPPGDGAHRAGGGDGSS